MTDKTIREMQTTLPWSIRYSRDYRANPQPHKDFTHALLHVGKALGHLQGLADDMDHDREVADDPTLRERYAKYLADLVVCALRASNVFPGGVVDLQKAVEERIVNKNTVNPPPLESKPLTEEAIARLNAEVKKSIPAASATIVCPECHGTGEKPDSLHGRFGRCEACDGRGTRA